MLEFQMEKKKLLNTFSCHKKEITYSTEEKLEILSSGPGVFFLVRFSTKVGIGKSSIPRISLNSAGDLDRVNSCLCFKTSSSVSILLLTKTSVFKLAGKL